MGNWTEYAKFFAALVAIVNPIGCIPIFINLTADQSPAERNRSSRVAAYAAGAVLLVTLVSGETVLRFFGISIASFRVGGGILILLMALSMMHARVSPVKHTEEEARDSAEKENIAVVPIGIPILAGPGAISTVILYGHRHPSPEHALILGIEIVLVCLCIWLSCRTAPFLAKALGRTGINIVTRIMGLIMAAIGVEFIAYGLRQLFPLLAGSG